jgi:hypothetical protein
MEYPESVITKSKKGEKEVRLLVDKGQFIRYQYMDPKTGKIVEKGKFSIILKTAEKEEHLYLIPLNKGKALVIYPKSEAKQRKVWNKQTKNAEKVS